MQQTTNYNLNLIENSDEIISSIDGINNNFKTIDENLGKGGGGSGDILTFINKTVSTSSWVSDTTYEEFGYKVDIPCEGVTAEFFSDVVFDVVEATSGNYAPISVTGNGIVTIYAVEQPENNITIPTIICSKGA